MIKAQDDEMILQAIGKKFIDLTYEEKEALPPPPPPAKAVLRTPEEARAHDREQHQRQQDEAKRARPISKPPVLPGEAGDAAVIAKASPPLKGSVKRVLSPAGTAAPAAPPKKAPSKAMPSAPTSSGAGASSSTDPMQKHTEKPGVKVLSTTSRAKADQPLVYWKGDVRREIKVFRGQDVPGVERVRDRLPDRLFQASKKFSSLTRGFDQLKDCKFRVPPLDSSLYVNFDEALNYIRRRYLKGLTLEEAIIAVCSTHRFILKVEMPIREGELYAQLLPFRPKAIRSVQGHHDSVKEDEESVVGFKRTISADPLFTLTDFQKGWRPRVSNIFAEHQELIEPKILWHYTSNEAAKSSIMTGLFPGGIRGQKPYVFLSKYPPWQVARSPDREMAKSRPAALAIDLEVCVQYGYRFVETQSGHILTPDWVSNQYIVCLFDQQTQVFPYANQYFAQVRKDVNDECSHQSIQAAKDEEWRQQGWDVRPVPELRDESNYSEKENRIFRDYDRWCDRVDLESPTMLKDTPQYVHGVEHQLARTKEEKRELEYAIMATIFRIERNRGLYASMRPKHLLVNQRRFAADEMNPSDEGMRNCKWRFSNMLMIPDSNCPRCASVLPLGFNICVCCGLFVGIETDMAKASYMIRLEEMADIMGYEIGLDNFDSRTFTRGRTQRREVRGERSILGVLVHHARDHV